jgi:predicted Zn-dependent protease
VLGLQQQRGVQVKEQIMGHEVQRDHVAVRLDAATQARIDAVAKTLGSPWGKATASEVLRAVILAGLEALEATAPARSDAPAAPAEPPAES